MKIRVGKNVSSKLKGLKFGWKIKTLLAVFVAGFLLVGVGGIYLTVKGMGWIYQTAKQTDLTPAQILEPEKFLNSLQVASGPCTQQLLGLINVESWINVPVADKVQKIKNSCGPLVGLSSPVGSELDSPDPKAPQEVLKM